MENLEVMVVLFIIVILGYVACKLGYMGDKFDKKLSSMVVDITCPLLVLSSVMGDELPDRTLILPLLGVGFLTYILLLVFGFGVPRLITRNHNDQGMIGFALMFANVGFIGYPIVSAFSVRRPFSMQPCSTCRTHSLSLQQASCSSRASTALSSSILRYCFLRPFLLPSWLLSWLPSGFILLISLHVQ